MQSIYRVGVIILLASFITFIQGCAATHPNAVKEPAFEPLFNGKDLDGWEGNTTLWSVENGEIIGKSPGIKNNEFLATKERYGDFVLKFTFRIVNTSGQANSGMQFRSERVANSTECYGYQADVGQDYWGCLYDESRRKVVLVKPPAEELEKVLKRDGWNEYVIMCEGPHITLTLNGYKTVDYVEKEPEDKAARSGIFALQLHAGGPMEVHVKEVVVKRLGVKK